MKIIESPKQVRGECVAARHRGAKIGLVPTMGALHDGHASLVRLARERCSFVVVSIFVNPKQFGPNEDFARYPRTMNRDSQLLRRLGCDLLFAPSEKDLYSSHDRTRISIEGLSDVLCGSVRRGHFDGVALVVAKLLNIVGPDEAFFGQKDAQQAVIIQRMVADLDIPVKVVIGPTIREPDGLAMSSRNAYLDADTRSKAPAMYGALLEAKKRIEKGARSSAAIKSLIESRMRNAGFDVDYAEVVNGETLEPIENISGKVLIACAGRLGGTRLIDNVALKVLGERVEEILLEFPEWSRYG